MKVSINQDLNVLHQDGSDGMHPDGTPCGIENSGVVKFFTMDSTCFISFFSVY